MTQPQKRPITNLEDVRAEVSQDPRAIRSRKELKEALLSLLKHKTFAEITAAELASEAGVTRAAFYRHHSSKEAMLNNLAEEEIARLYQQGLQALETSGARAAALTLCHYLETNRDLWSILLNGGAKGIIREKFLSLSLAVSARRASTNDRLPSALSTAFSAAASAEIIAWWVDQDVDRSPQYFAELVSGLIYNPIKALSTNPALKLR